jgi:glyoxylase-like metal-dependent hydrolase (beta-lactamase superfamily II)
MQTHRLNDNLTQITRLHFVNAYLVREDDGFTLVDTTTGGGADDLIEAAQAAGGTIRRIALTHGHGDDVGSLDAL